MDAQSCIVYGGLLVFDIMVALAAQKKERKNMLLLAVFAMTLVAGLRSFSVGIDTQQYARFFKLLEEGKFDQVYALEKSFMYLCAGLMKIFKDQHVLFAIFAAITHGLVLMRLWDYRDDILLPWAVSCYYIMFFPESLNVMRQLVAIAFVFYGTRYLSRKKYLLFFLFVGVAFLFHNSALIGLGFFFVNVFFDWRLLEKEKKFKLIKIIAIVVTATAVLAVLLIFKWNIIARYQKYLINIRLHFGLMLFAKFFFLLGTIVLMRREMMDPGESEHNRIYIRHIQLVRIYYGIGIILTSLGYVLKNANRIGWYYGIMEAVYFGMIVKEGKFRWLFRTGVVAILLYTFIIRLFKGSNGEIPYLFFWQA